MTLVYVSIGSNVEKTKHIRKALDYLHGKFNILQVSPVYESESVGFSGFNFYNLVACFNTNLGLSEVARQLRLIEFVTGRTASDGKNHNRNIDIDMLIFGNYVEFGGRINVPRDDILRYSFVLRPLSDIAPYALHPELLESYKLLWERFRDDGQKLWRVGFSWGGKIISSSEGAKREVEKLGLPLYGVA